MCEQGRGDRTSPTLVDIKALVATFSDVLQAYGNRLVRGHGESIAQSAITAAFTGLNKGTFKPASEEQVLPWLLRVAYAKAMNRLRDKYRRNECGDEALNGHSSPDSCPLDAAMQTEFSEIVKPFVDSLDDRQRLVLANLMDEASLRDIVSRTDLSLHSVRKAVDQIRLAAERDLCD